MFIVLFLNPESVAAGVAVSLLVVLVFFPRVGVWVNMVGFLLAVVFGGSVFSIMIYAMFGIVSLLYTYSVKDTIYSPPDV